MKLAALKERTYQTWLIDYLIDDPETPVQTATTDLAFKSVIRDRFGDLRRKATWEAAFATIEAKSMYDHFDERHFLIEHNFIEFPEQYGYNEYVPQILEQFLQLKGGMECIVSGLQSVLKNGLFATTKPAILNFLQLGYQVAKRLELEQAFSSAMADSLPLLTASAA
ncbi:hypothetical protein C7B82_07400 [Stenomitos frigidus ULC18]|uniref:Uncharacterized protein n=2 Tax=Stenomitos TaxID=1844270 RepID=A0A2T1EFM0_9CYAN|nr:hypothetical protein C7B82_07400 [Stenomitos frigidus ULC18]